MKGHSWHVMPWAELVRQMGAYVKKNTPAGEDRRPGGTSGVLELAHAGPAEIHHDDATD